MRKRSPTGGRMRAGACRRRIHVSRQCVAGCISCSIESWHAAKTDGPTDQRTRGLRGGGGSEKARGGPRIVCPPLGGARPALPPCAGFGRAAGAYPAEGDPGRLGAPAPQRPRSPGLAQPRILSLAPASRPAPLPTSPSPRRSPGATASPAGTPAKGSASCGLHPPGGG